MPTTIQAANSVPSWNDTEPEGAPSWGDTSPVTETAAPPTEKKALNPPRLQGEGDTAYLRRTNVWPPSGEGEVESAAPIIPASVIKAGYKASPLYWAARAAYPKQTEGATEGLAETASGFTTPGNLALLATAPVIPGGVVGKVAETGLGAYFEAQAVKELPDQWKQFQETTDPQEKWKLGVQMASGLGLPLTAVAHVVGRGAELQKGGIDSALETENVPKFEETRPATTENATVSGKPLETPGIQPDQPQAPKASPHDFLPALRSPEGEMAVGEQGQAHADLIKANPEIGALDPDLGFADKEGNFKTRQEVSDALGEPEPMQSQRLAELQAQPAPTTGIANRVLRSESEAGRIDPVEPGEGISWQESVDRGRQLLNRGSDPQMIARRIERTGRLSADDMAVLRAERERLFQQTNQAAEVVLQNPADPAARATLQAARTAESDFIRNAVQPAKTQWHRLGMATQGEAPVDATTFSGLRRAALDTHGRDLDSRESRQVSEIADRTRRSSDEASRAVNKANDRIQKRFGAKNPPRTLDQLRDDLAKRTRDATPCA